jgi:biopolymer transport protein ExbD
MAAIIENAVPHSKRKSFARVKKHSLATDMTPMVDLGFLLITFFIITVELSKPNNTPLAMPKKGTDMPVAASNSLTVILDKDNSVYYYEGELAEAIAGKKFLATSFSPEKGIRQIIINKQKQLDLINPTGEKRDGLMLMIKATDETNYENVMKVFDEALINVVKKYALVKPETAELEYIRTLSHH